MNVKWMLFLALNFIIVIMSSWPNSVFCCVVFQRRNRSALPLIEQQMALYAVQETVLQKAPAQDSHCIPLTSSSEEGLFRVWGLQFHLQQQCLQERHRHILCLKPSSQCENHSSHPPSSYSWVHECFNRVRYSSSEVTWVTLGIATWHHPGTMETLIRK